MPFEESHDNQFKGWWIPAEVVCLFQEGEITAKEMALLATIDGFVAHGKYGKGVACFASNKALGRYTNCEERNIQVMLSKLKSMGLVRELGFDGRKRYLDTKWSPADYIYTKSCMGEAQ